MCLVLYLSEMPGKYVTYTEPTLAIYETDITKNLCVKVEKIENLHQLYGNEKQATKNLSICFALFSSKS